ncbi:MAG: hypothetical protein IBX61_07225 [Thermoleophilia bacterium]|nr:hypothetical protein [Thermoleophilia bacterium]
MSSRRFAKLAAITLGAMMLTGVWSITDAQGSVGDMPTTTRPDLGISVTNVYWASYADYQERDLSVDFSMNNKGAADAFNVAITGSGNTGGVTMSGTPAAVGDISAGSSAPVMLVYNVPAGVTSFKTSITATAQDGDENSYDYPLNPAANLVYSTNVKPATVSVIDVDSQTLVNNFFLNYLDPNDNQGHFVSLTPDGKYLWVSEQMSATGGYVAVLDAATGEELKHWDVGAGVANFMSRDGKWVFITSQKLASVNVFDVENQTYLGAIPIGSAPHVIDQSPDGTILYVTDLNLGNLRSFDMTSLPGALPAPIATLPIGNLTHALLAHPNGDYVFVGSSGAAGTKGTVIVDVNTMSIVMEQAGGVQGGLSLTPHNYDISPDAKYLVIGDISTYT